MGILDDIWYNPEKERQKEEERQKAIELAEEKLADKVMFLLGDDIPDKSIFKDEFIFYSSVIDNAELLKLIDEEMNAYSQSNTLRIAEIFWAASDFPEKHIKEYSNGTRVHYLFTVHRLTSFCFYLRAAKRGSRQAMEKVAMILGAGEQGIPKDLILSKKYSTLAAKSGGIDTYFYCDFTLQELNEIQESLDSYASIGYLIYYVKKNDQKNIRIYLDMIVKDFMDTPLLLLGVAYTFSEHSYQNKYYEKIAEYLKQYI